MTDPTQPDQPYRSHGYYYCSPTSRDNVHWSPIKLSYQGVVNVGTHYTFPEAHCLNVLKSCQKRRHCYSTNSTKTQCVYQPTLKAGETTPFTHQEQELKSARIHSLLWKYGEPNLYFHMFLTHPSPGGLKKKRKRNIHTTGFDCTQHIKTNERNYQLLLLPSINSAANTMWGRRLQQTPIRYYYWSH